MHKISVDDKLQFIRKWFKKTTPADLSLGQKWKWYKSLGNAAPKFFAGDVELTQQELRQIIMSEE